MDHNLIAIIELNTESIEMTLYEKYEKKTKILEDVFEPLHLFKNLNEANELSFEKLKKMSDLLKKMKLLAIDYGVENIKVVMNESFSHISNLPLVIDHIKLFTGLSLSVDSIENRRNYVAKNFIFSHSEIIDKGESCFFLNLSGFFSDFFVFYRGDLLAKNEIPFGTYKLFNTLVTHNLNYFQTLQFADDYLANYFHFFSQEVGRKSITNLIVELGIEKKTLLNLFKNSTITHENMKNILKIFQHKSIEEISIEFNITSIEVKLLFSNLAILHSFASNFAVKKIIILSKSIKEIIVTEEFFPESNKKIENILWKITLDSVTDLIKKHKFSLAHPEFVANTAVELFKVLKKSHLLGNKYEKYLILAAYLHEIGKFIGFRNYSDYSCYIIENSQIFYLNERDLKSISFLVYALNKKISISELYDFKKNDPNFVELLKLAALLNIAVALDQSRKQKANKISYFQDKTSLYVELETKEDCFMEILAFEQKSALFRYVFDLDITLNVDRRFNG